MTGRRRALIYMSIIQLLLTYSICSLSRAGNNFRWSCTSAWKTNNHINNNYMFKINLVIWLLMSDYWSRLLKLIYKLRWVRQLTPTHCSTLVPRLSPSCISSNTHIDMNLESVVNDLMKFGRNKVGGLKQGRRHHRSWGWGNTTPTFFSFKI